jgi:TrpR-related protein YerC/YecD
MAKVKIHQALQKDNLFSKEESYEPKNEKEKRLCEAFLRLKNREDVENFLRDLMTMPEIEEFSNRLEIARLLSSGESYLKIAKMVGVSTTTVSRTAHWLFRGCGGYWKVLKK